MTKADLQEAVLKLPVDERLELAHALWESASPPPSFELSDAQKQLLDERMKQVRERPEDCLSHDEFTASVERLRRS